MPKHHRQPEPIDILAAGMGTASAASSGTRRAVGNANNGGAKRPRRGEAPRAEEGPDTAVLPATLSTLATDRKARRKALRAATGRLEDYGDTTSSARDSSVNSEPQSGEVEFDSSELGDDGNQADDSVGDIFGEDSDRDEDYDAFLRGRRPERSGRLSDEDDSDDDSDDESEDDESEVDESEDDEMEKEKAARRRRRRATTDSSDDEEEDSDEAESAVESDDDSDDDDDNGEDADDKRVNVDFDVYDMKKSHIDAVYHLMDQLCPDRMDEVHREDFGAALAENPYTYVVTVGTDEQTKGEGEEDDEERDAAAEIYGLVSALDVAHSIRTHPASFKPLYKLLHGAVWRVVERGIPPVELLLSTTSGTAGRVEASRDDGDTARCSHKKPRKEAVRSPQQKSVDGEGDEGLTKCLLLVSEYVRNVPLELTVQILDDLVSRVEKDAKAAGGTAAAAHGSAVGKKMDAVRATPGSMFAVLAKVQRTLEPPVSLADAKKQRKKEKDAGAEAAGSSSGRMRDEELEKTCAKEDEVLDLSRYTFWREEDNVLYDYRDKRVATFSYKCRPQYEGQPEQDVPLSLLFVLQHGALRQAIEEMKRRATVSADITRY